MKKVLFILLLLTATSGSTQQLSFAEIGSEPAYCRKYYYQSGNGVVWAAVTGGVPDYDYTWVNLESGNVLNGMLMGGLNPGYYEITVTDAVGTMIKDTVYVDSLNPVASFDIISSDFFPYPDGWVSVGGYSIAEFVNTSSAFAIPNNPNADTTFFWSWDAPNEPWVISHDYNEVYYKGYGPGLYHPSLICMNKNGCTDTTSATLIVFGPVGIEEVPDDSFFMLNPIPSQQTLQYNSGGVQAKKLVIYDLQGKLISTFTLDSYSGEIIFNQPTGMYVYELLDQNNKTLSHGKFVY